MEGEGAGHRRRHSKAQADKAGGIVQQRLPSRMCIIRLGMDARWAIAETAIGSVGEITAASAKATASDMAGIIQWMKKPMPMTVNTTRPSASPSTVLPSLNSSSRGYASRRGTGAAVGRGGRISRIERHPPIRHEADQPAERDLEQRARQWQGQDPGENAAQDDGE